jgi:hypothetical protein
VAEFDSVIPAGGSGKLIAEIRTAPVRARRMSKSIGVQTDAQGAANLTLRFTVTARAPILFNPGARFVIYSLEGVEARQRVLLQHADGEKLEIYGARAEHESLDVVIEPVVEKEHRDGIEAEPGDVWLELVLPENTPVGTQQGNLRVATSHPLARSLTVPYVTRVRPVISPNPEGLRLWIPGNNSEDGASSFLSLRHNQQGSFRVTGLVVSHPEVFTATALSTEAAPLQTIRVKLVEGLTPDAIGVALQGWIEITTEPAARAELEVPVLVAPTREGTRRQFRHR